jgi:glucokinase
MTIARAPSKDPPQARYALGVDVGGTKIAGGIVDLETGAITSRRVIPTDYARGGEPVLADVIDLVRDLLAETRKLGLPPQTLGLCVAELVDKKGRIFSDHRIAWSQIDVAARLGAILPTTLSADVRAAALAEAHFGAGRGLSDFYFVTIGTGVSGVLVLNGLPYAGSRGAALVIANTQRGHICSKCGAAERHMVEDIASGPGLVAAYGTGARAEEVLAAAEGGDAKAISVIERAAGELAGVLAILADGLDPQAMIFGGGLGSAPGPYFPALKRALRAALWDGVDHPFVVSQAALGSDAGLIGAAVSTRIYTPSNHQPN